MGKRLLVTALLGSALTWVAVPAAQAIDCDAAIKHAEHNLALVEAQVDQVRESTRPRIEAFLNEARRLLAQARTTCDQAQGNMDKAEAAAKAALAQGDIAAASVFVKVD